MGMAGGRMSWGSFRDLRGCLDVRGGEVESRV
jgi:hypothetical protein